MGAGKGRVRSAGDLSRATVRSITLSNLAVMLTLFVVCLTAAGLFVRASVFQQIDAEMDRQLQGFTKSHLSVEAHSDRLPNGLLPVIYLHTEDEGFFNPHPSGSTADVGAAEILKRDLSEGYSTAEVGGQSFRVLRTSYNPPQTFWEQDESFRVIGTISVYDVTSEVAMLHTLFAVDAAAIVVAAVVFGIACFLLARRALVPIRAAWEKQRQSAADTSHELRNPVAIIQANAEALLRHPQHTVEEEGPHVAAILDSTRRMSAMLSTLLTLARSDADEDELQCAEVRLGETVSVLAEQFANLGEARGVAVFAKVTSTAVVWGDEGRIVELLSVLLDNALRYTPAGGEVAVECFDRHDRAVVVVRDTGIGMTEREREMVFQRFFRSEEARKMNPEGTGLGLAIAQWITERHGADFLLASEPSKGTEITISFPTM